MELLDETIFIYEGKTLLTSSSFLKIEGIRILVLLDNMLVSLSIVLRYDVGFK